MNLFFSQSYWSVVEKCVFRKKSALEKYESFSEMPYFFSFFFFLNHIDI